MAAVQVGPAGRQRSIPKHIGLAGWHAIHASIVSYLPRWPARYTAMFVGSDSGTIGAWGVWTLTRRDWHARILPLFSDRPPAEAQGHIILALLLVVGLLVGILILGGAVHSSGSRKPVGLREPSLMQFCNETEAGCGNDCGLVEDGFDYFGGDLFSLGDIENESVCCAHCRREPNCTSWTWVCYLKRQLELKRHGHAAAISGFPTSQVVTFQIKSRHGLCMEWEGDAVFLAECGNSSQRSQQWSVHLKLHQIRTEDGRCLDSPECKDGGVVQLRACLHTLHGQHWIFARDSGLIENFAKYCLMAPSPTTKGSNVTMWACSPAGLGHRWGFWFTSTLNDPKVAEAKKVEATTMTTTTHTTHTHTAPGDSLFCYTVMLATGEEKQLMVFHASGRHGIFSCNEAMVLSSVTVHLGNDFWTQVLPGTDLYVAKGGPWGTAMNTPVFIAVWSYIKNSRRYEHYDWSVKVDPDAVFLPWRLRKALTEPEFREAEMKKGVIIHNCGNTLHGPIEVMSRRALAIFTDNLHHCQRKPQEDFFLSLCADKLGVDVHFRQDILADQGCLLNGGRLKDPDWWKCESGHAAFHPFKTLSALEGCYSRAWQASS
eukprot:CAMPEP_0179188938 /NCGR_PEP_ID=MMETSP0796-20121207/93784_1 /TAXON_ID=73915 /ORGANISM="Pyrodinium bahamense, Strain pbaha01" /LENGTH=599 /DNA_ID=CAMNT_0020893057 /DNA_START=19 /DNA_END=1818 /DNA_ORIENTATION=-